MEVYDPSITESADCYDMDRDLEVALSDLDKGLKEVENKYISFKRKD